VYLQFYLSQPPEKNLKGPKMKSGPKKSTRPKNEIWPKSPEWPRSKGPKKEVWLLKKSNIEL
jgi:hypothetical protein